MKLTLIRHTDALDLSSVYPRDELRPISDIGKKNLHRSIKAWKLLNLKFDCVFCSPYLRARQTANLIRKNTLIKSDIIVAEDLVPHGVFDPIMNRLEGLDSQSVALVTHDPLVTQFAHFILGLSSQKFKFSPATLMGLDVVTFFPTPAATMELFVKV